jgi:hypothetical protein
MPDENDCGCAGRPLIAARLGGQRTSAMAADIVEGAYASVSAPLELVEEHGPSYLLGNLVMLTGQIHRTTDFETGFTAHFARIGRHWQPDPYIHDDQALVVNLRGKGLVVLTGCGPCGRDQHGAPGARSLPRGARVCDHRGISSFGTAVRAGHRAHGGSDAR